MKLYISIFQPAFEINKGWILDLFTTQLMLIKRKTYITIYLNRRIKFFQIYKLKNIFSD